MRRAAFLLITGALLAASCGEATSHTSTASTAQPASESTTTEPESLRLKLTSVRIISDEAVAVNVAGTVENVVVAWTTDSGVYVAEVGDTEIGAAERVNGEIPPFAHPIERPAVAVDEDGAVNVAFTAPAEGGGSVMLVEDAGSGSPPQLISGEPLPETNLVWFAKSPEDELAIAWIEAASLSVSRSGTEVEKVDDTTCDCCNPAPLFLGEVLTVAYRDQAKVDERITRDTALVRSLDGGTTWEDPATIADDHWYVDACPFTGPSTVSTGETLVVAFMDARQSVHPNQDGSTIWVDVSTDAGATFGADLEVSRGGINRWPVMAADNGLIHLIWEKQGPEGGLMYARSSDEGHTFTEPQQLLAPTEATGTPRYPTLVSVNGRLWLTWVDRQGAKVGIVDPG